MSLAYPSVHRGEGGVFCGGGRVVAVVPHLRRDQVPAERAEPLATRVRQRERERERGFDSAHKGGKEGERDERETEGLIVRQKEGGREMIGREKDEREGERERETEGLIVLKRGMERDEREGER